MCACHYLDATVGELSNKFKHLVKFDVYDDGTIF